MKIEDIVKSFATFSHLVGMKVKTIPYAFSKDVRNDFEIFEGYLEKRENMVG